MTANRPYNAAMIQGRGKTRSDSIFRKWFNGGNGSQFLPLQNPCAYGLQYAESAVSLRNNGAIISGKSRVRMIRGTGVVLDSCCEWMQDAIRVPSPNCDQRPPGSEVSLLVVHAISLPPGEFGGPWIDQLFTNQLDAGAHPYFREVAGLRVSSHVLIRRDGAVVQYVPFTQRAWHAGPSCFEGAESCNDFSIGIELEGEDHVPYTEAQYAQLVQVICVLREAFPAIRPDRIVGHCDIAPERKTDPGPAFDWNRLHQLIAS